MQFSLCVCLHVCVFIKFYITAQFGPINPVILCYPHWSSQEGINDTVCMCCVFINLHIIAQSGPVSLVILCYLH